MSNSSRRSILRSQLREFYRQHDPGNNDPARLERSVNYGLMEGLEALNAGLIVKFGDYIDPNGSSQQVLEDHRDFFRVKIEMFYLIYFPSKLDKPEDVHAIVEWALIHGVGKLNQKLQEKFSATLKDATAGRAKEAIILYYQRLGINKSDKDYNALLEWGTLNSFCSLNQRLIKRYKKGFGAMDQESKRKEIKAKLVKFYGALAPEQLGDGQNLDVIVEWTLHNGEEKLNARLEQKYGANLNTENIGSRRPGTAAKLPARDADNESLVDMDEPDDAFQDKAIQDAIAVREYRTFLNYFFAKWDQEKLYDGSVNALVEDVLVKGIDAVSSELGNTYGQDLMDTIDQHRSLSASLTLFYSNYDPLKLKDPENMSPNLAGIRGNSSSVENIVGWALVHGKSKLNEKLLVKYDDDLEGTGLRRRLVLFYSHLGVEKPDSELDNVVKWAFKHGINKLNARMKEKYGKSLEDDFMMEEEPSEDGEGKMEEAETAIRKKVSVNAAAANLLVDVVDGDEDELEKTESLDMPYVSTSVINRAKAKELKRASHSAKENSSSSGEMLAMDALYSKSKGKKSTSAPTEEAGSDPMEGSLVLKIQKFYAKHPPENENVDEVVLEGVQYVYKNGIEEFNKHLMDRFGESLNAVENKRKQTFLDFLDHNVEAKQKELASADKGEEPLSSAEIKIKKGHTLVSFLDALG